MTDAAALLIAFAIYLLGITTGLRWARRVFPRSRDPNPFGELPPVQPTLERSYHIPTVDRATLDVTGVECVLIHHNTKPEARN